MLQSPRMISVLLCIIGLNAGLVVWSIVDRHSMATAGAPGLIAGVAGLTTGAPAQTPDENAQVTDENAQVTDENAQATGEAAPRSADQRLLDSIPLPDAQQLSIPETPADIESDVAFQKFREAAAEYIPTLPNSLLEQANMATLDSATLGHANPESTSPQVEVSFEQMERRLQVVSHLTAAALGLMREAEQHAQAGAATQATELMQKTRQLRQLAAELLAAGP